MILAPLSALALAAGLIPAATGTAVPYDTAQATVSAGRVAGVVSNVGSFGFDLTTGLAAWSEGFEYPRGSGTRPFFPIGLWVTGQVGGVERAAICEYVSEFRPGPVLPGGAFAPDDPAYTVYRAARKDTTGWAAWVARGGPLGAPLDSAGDAPLVRGNVSTWAVYNDADPSRHVPHSGLEPLGLEVRQTTWAFDEAGPRGGAILFRWEILERGTATLDSAYVGLWADPDVGGRADFVATDSANGLAYNYDLPGTDAVYGTAQPAFGLRMTRGPRVPPGGTDLGVTSIATYVNGVDPATPQECARLLRGLRVNGTPYVDPATGAPTRFPFSDDPRTGVGWLDANPADKKFVLGSGPFTFAPGDTQVIDALLIVGQGADRIASIDSLYGTALADYDAPAVDPPPPPGPAPRGLEAAPSPARGPVALRFASRAGVSWRLDAYDVRGRAVTAVAAGEGTGATVVATWSRPPSLASGVYWILLRQGEERMARPVVLVQ